MVAFEKWMVNEYPKVLPKGRIGQAIKYTYGIKTQIWIAVCTYLLVAYAKKQLKSDLSLYEITQILSVSVFDKTPINELLTNFSKNDEIKDIYNQLNLFDL